MNELTPANIIRSLKSPVGRLLLRRSFVTVLALASLAYRSQVYAGPFDTFYGDGAGASTTTGSADSGFGYSALLQNTTGDHNTAVGFQALLTNSSGNENTAVGFDALAFSTGNSNTASGAYALLGNQSGSYNAATGSYALYYNTTGWYNTASGHQALYNNTGGNYNMASATVALYNNTTGNNNTASGYSALYFNTTGNSNTASGTAALFYNTTASYNTASGDSALYKNTTGNNNMASGAHALLNNTTGNFNMASGTNALASNTTANYNTASGDHALYNNTTGANNVALGYQAGLNLTTGNNNIVIGAGVLGVAGDANKIRIGKSIHTATYIGGIYNKSVASANGVAVFVDSTGKLGTVKSSARYKDNIKPMDRSSEAILKLEPVTFRYKEELDPDGVTQFGLIAEQVEKVDPDLVVRDEDDKVSTVRYEAVNAMLLNEFLKEHRIVEQQQAMIAEMKSAIAQQQKEIKALRASAREQLAIIQKVSRQMETSKAAPQLLTTN